MCDVRSCTTFGGLTNNATRHSRYASNELTIRRIQLEEVRGRGRGGRERGGTINTTCKNTRKMLIHKKSGLKDQQVTHLMPNGMIKGNVFHSFYYPPTPLVHKVSVP